MTSCGTTIPVLLPVAVTVVSNVTLFGMAIIVLSRRGTRLGDAHIADVQVDDQRGAVSSADRIVPRRDQIRPVAPAAGAGG
jgi:hypothetical protein